MQSPFSWIRARRAIPNRQNLFQPRKPPVTFRGELATTSRRLGTELAGDEPPYSPNWVGANEWSWHDFLEFDVAHPKRKSGKANGADDRWDRCLEHWGVHHCRTAGLLVAPLVALWPDRISKP